MVTSPSPSSLLAMLWSASNPHVVTTSIRKTPITLPTSSRRTTTSPFISIYATALVLTPLIHMGKHGNLEWLPGKALTLSESCLPEAILGPTPHIYPFIVNDPGEGTQAKRRTSAVIIDHLTPPLTRAETYGPLRDLEALVDEYYEAAGVDPRRLTHLRKEILSLTSATGINLDAGMDGGDEENDLAKLDEYLCELKEAQIRDGLHIFGTSPEDRLETDLIAALTPPSTRYRHT